MKQSLLVFLLLVNSYKDENSFHMERIIHFYVECFKIKNSTYIEYNALIYI